MFEELHSTTKFFVRWLFKQQLLMKNEGSGQHEQTIKGLVPYITKYDKNRLGYMYDSQKMAT